MPPPGQADTMNDKELAHRQLPWGVNGENFTVEERDEIDHFSQALEREFPAKILSFHKELREMEKQFHKELDREREIRMHRFMGSLWDTDIDDARKHTVPAYTFPVFLKLPRELQLRIWEIAAPATEPRRMYRIASRKDEEHYVKRFSDRNHEFHSGSSRLFFDQYYKGPYLRPFAHPVACVCHDSRKITLSRYASFPCMQICRFSDVDNYEVNIVEDGLYMALHSWQDFKILVDILLSLNTTSPALADTREDLQKFRSMRTLALDFHIFASMPRHIWPAFSKLKEVIICFYPFNDHKDIENRTSLGNSSDPESFGDLPSFIIPHPTSKLGKRADWILGAATNVFDEINATFPIWKTPEIKVLLVSTNTNSDPKLNRKDVNIDCWRAWDVQKSLEDGGENREHNTTGVNPQADDPTKGKDSLWYSQASARMSKKETIGEIEALKKRY